MHSGSIYELVKGKDEHTFLSAGSEGIVVEWNILAPEKATAIAKVNGQIFSLLYLEENNHLVIGTMSGGLHVIDLTQKKEIHYITFHDQSLFSIKRWKEKLFVASKDGKLSVWSIKDYKLEQVITISDMSLRMIDFHPSKDEAAIACSDNNCYLVDLRQWKIKTVLRGPENSVFSIRYSADGKQLLAGSRDAQLYQFDLADNRLARQIKAHLYTINDIQLIAGSEFFATASRDKTIRIWNAETLELGKSIDKKYDGHIHSVNKMLWLPSANYLVSGSDDRSVILWKITSGGEM
jgi:WD40 repeat protein